MASKAASTNVRERPLSPHLGVWRWHITMVTSILHRVSGVGLSAGALVLTAWLAAAAAGPVPYSIAESWLLSPIGRLILFGFTLSATFHLANGVRHLIWDTGAGFAPKTANAASVFVLLFTLVSTFAVWAAAYWL